MSDICYRCKQKFTEIYPSYTDDGQCRPCFDFTNSSATIEDIYEHYLAASDNAYQEFRDRQLTHDCESNN